jgi:prepilin-type N-terminal cleavage/methylation domain-containing protein/prepilin-type processing-associated H-X9-DG protein
MLLTVAWSCLKVVLVGTTHRSGGGEDMEKCNDLTRTRVSRGCVGFTLVELLVCIAVIAILASLLLPVMASAKAKTVGLSCLNNLRQINIACLVYTDDFNDRLPYNLGQAEIAKGRQKNVFNNWCTPIMNWEAGSDSDNTNSALLTVGGIGGYTGNNPRIYRCPADIALSDDQLKAGWGGRVRSISMNAMTGNAGEFSRDGVNVNDPEYKQFFRLGAIPKPSGIFLFVDEHPDSINDGYFVNNHDSGRWNDLPASYHSGGANLTFADGHAERHTWKFPSTKPPARPDAATLPFAVPHDEKGDFEWLMYRTSIDNY